MAISCVQCGQSIGFFKKPVARIYCSAACEAAAAQEEAEAQRRVDTRPPPSSAETAPDSHASSRPPPTHSGVTATVDGLRVPCPKCSADWTVAPGAGALGRSRGACRQCGFEAEFVALADCPNCRVSSLVVQDHHEARCPRCKTRVRHASMTG